MEADSEEDETNLIEKSVLGRSLQKTDLEQNLGYTPPTSLQAVRYINTQLTIFATIINTITLYKHHIPYIKFQAISSTSIFIKQENTCIIFPL